MNKYLFNIVSVSCFLLLVSCQSTTQSGFFPRFSSQLTPTQSVQDALVGTGDPVLSQIRVEPGQDGVVLSGYVKKIRQSDTAEQIARQVHGVHNVENRIVVKP